MLGIVYYFELVLLVGIKYSWVIFSGSVELIVVLLVLVVELGFEVVVNNELVKLMEDMLVNCSKLCVLFKSNFDMFKGSGLVVME